MIAGPAFGQTPPAPPPGQLPGSTVGSSFTYPISQPVPNAAPGAGMAIGLAPTPGGAGGATSPAAMLPGGSFDPSAVVGPLPSTLLPPAEKTLWQKFVDKYGVDLGLLAEAPPPTGWTPGIGRRNRERREREMLRWWRD